MKRADALKSKTPTPEEGELKLGTASNPTMEFIGAVMTMSWQLAIAVLVPVLGGYFIDQKVDSAPLWTIIGFVLAAIMTALLFRQVLWKYSVNKDKHS